MGALRTAIRLGFLGWAMASPAAFAHDAPERSSAAEQMSERAGELPTIAVDVPHTGDAGDPTGSPQPLPRGTIQEIVVTAQKRAESLQDVPIAMSALSQDDIADRQITSIGDIAAQTAGFEYGEVGGAGQVSIRGVGFSLFSGAGENSVAIHADGVYLPQPASSNLMYEDLGRIELLRGPQGTLYGRNATAGVLNLISVAPPAEPELGGSLSYGDYDRRKFKLQAGTGLLDARLRVRAAVATDRTGDDLFENLEYPGRDQGGRDLDTQRFNADFDATDDLGFELRAFRAREEANGPHYEAYRPPAGAVLAPPGTYTSDPFTHRNNNAGRAMKDLDGGAFRVRYALGEHWSVVSLTGYSRFRFLTHDYDGDGTSNDLITVAVRDNQDRTVSEELLVAFDGERAQWTTGLYFLDERFQPEIHSLIDVVGAANLGLDFVGSLTDPALLNFIQQLLAAAPIGGQAEADIHFASDEDTRSLAFFTDLTLALFDDLRIYAGLRHTDEDKKQVLTIRIVEAETGLGLVQCRDLRTRLGYKATTGRVGLQYDLVEDLMAYVQFARGFKAGGFSIAACGDTFEPEEVDSYELGFKSMLFDHRLRANAAVFFYDYTNLQVEEINLPNAFVNNAQAEVAGAELELLFAPSSSWEISANVSYLDATYTEFINDDNAASIPSALGLGPAEDLAGRRLNRSPEWSVGGAIQYTLDLGQWGGVSLRGDADYKSDYYLREFNTPTDTQEAHTIVNVFLNYFVPGDRFVVRGFIKNLTDETVVSGLVGILGYKNAAFDSPRLWGFSLDFQFGG